MTEMIIGFIIWSLVGCVFIFIGIYSFFSQKAVGFWANVKMFEVTDVKKYNAAIEAKDVALAEKLRPETISVIDCAYKDGIYKKNTVARKKATLCRALDAIKA